MSEKKIVPISLDDFHNYAKSHLPKMAYEYYAHGSMDNETLNQNLKSYLNYRIRPRVMRDVSEVDTSVEIFNHKLALPVCIAPVAMQKMAHLSGEIGMAKGARDANTLMILSTLSNVNMEDIYREVPDGFFMFQLYILKDLELTKNLVKRAEKYNYKGIVITVDTPQVGNRLSDKKNNFQLPQSLRLENLENEEDDSDSDSDSEDEDEEKTPNTHQIKLNSQQKDSSVTIVDNISKDMDPTFNWNSIKEIKKITKLPILLKGILTAEDAKLAVEYGVDGIIVSNHGGRQLDTVPTTLEALPEVALAVDNKIPVFVDGGIRRGSDVFKALALGAKAVFIGRPAIWALNFDGDAGVKKMIDILIEEFRLTMALAGCTSVDQITSKHIQHKKAYLAKL